MKKSKKYILLMALIGFSPLIIAIIARIIGNQLGCADASGLRDCMMGDKDVTATLSFLTSLGAFAMGTVPLTLVTGLGLFIRHTIVTNGGKVKNS